MNPEPFDPDETIYFPVDSEQPVPPSQPTEPGAPYPPQAPTIPPPSGRQELPPTSPHAHYDPLAETRYHQVHLPKKKRLRRSWGCCLTLVLLPLLLLVPLLVFLFAPMRTNVLLLGLDARPGEGMVSRSDTIILTSFEPFQGQVSMFSIPRDLWVNIPGVGENRINTAHFFAEAYTPGSGPEAAMETVRANFGVNVDYYVRMQFIGLQEVVNALDGIDVELKNPMSGYPAGVHHLNGEQALALVRDRTGSDDFFRMERGQIFLKALLKQSLKPASWPRLPQAAAAVLSSADTNIPIWLWPRLGAALLRAGPEGINNRTITREMVTPFTTSGGAQVLGPNWDQINPVLMELFGQ